MFSLHTEARQGGVGKAGTVRELLHTTDVTHGLLPLPQGRGRDLHLVLLIWRDQQSKISRDGALGRVVLDLGQSYKGETIVVSHNWMAGLVYLER